MGVKLEAKPPDYMNISHYTFIVDDFLTHCTPIAKALQNLILPASGKISSDCLGIKQIKNCGQIVVKFLKGLNYYL